MFHSQGSGSMASLKQSVGSLKRNSKATLKTTASGVIAEVQVP